MTANIFISFAAQDRKVANTLCQALESRGFKCWISSRDILPGENFQIAIVRSIRKAKLMLLVFTANSNNSEEMNKELALASQQKLTVVPLRIEDVAPNDAFAYEFATRQWIDFFADWELAMGALASQIANVLGPDAPVEVAPAAAAPTVAALAETVVRPPSADITAPVEATPPAPELPEAEVPAIAESVVHEPDLAVPEPDLDEAEAVESVVEPPADAASVFHDDADHAAGLQSVPDAHPAYEPAAESPDTPVRKKGSPLPLIIGVLVLAVAAGVAAMFVLGKNAPATTTAASSAAPTAATAATPTVTLGPSASTAASAAASSAAPVATPAGTPPQAASAAEAADTSAATAAADGGDGQKTRRHGKGSSAAAPPLRATRSDIPY